MSNRSGVPTHNSKRLKIDGVEYCSMSDAVRKLGISSFKILKGAEVGKFVVEYI